MHKDKYDRTKIKYVRYIKEKTDKLKINNDPFEIVGTPDGMILKYVSKNYLIDPYTNYNCNYQSSDGEDISCRNLTHAMLLLDMKTKKYVRLFSYPRLYFKNNRSLMENEYDNKKTLLTAKEYLICPILYFFTFCSQRFSEMKINQSSKFYIDTDMHCMGLILIRKEFYYVFKFYDPNSTALHHRIVLPSPTSICCNEFLKAVPLDMFFDEEYFSQNMKLISISSFERRKKHTSPKVTVINKTYRELYFALSIELVKTAEEIMGKIINSSFPSSQITNKLLAIPDDDDRDLPGIHWAVVEDSGANAVKILEIYLQKILENKNLFTANDLWKLLSAKSRDEDGDSLLLTAVFESSEIKVQMICRAILQAESLLNKHDIIELLRAINPKFPNITLLFEALAMGLSEKVEILMETILATEKLSFSEKYNLLAAMKNNNTCGVLMAQQNGHTEAVAVYYQKILQSSMPTLYKEKLLKIKNNQKVSGLSLGGKNGKGETPLQQTKVLNAEISNPGDKLVHSSEEKEVIGFHHFQ